MESRPKKLKTVHKYSRRLISRLQLTTNQINPLAFTLENQNHLPLAPMLETLCRITSELEQLELLEKSSYNFTRYLYTQPKSRKFEVFQNYVTIEKCI